MATDNKYYNPLVNFFHSLFCLPYPRTCSTFVLLILPPVGLFVTEEKGMNCSHLHTYRHESIFSINGQAKHPHVCKLTHHITSAHTHTNKHTCTRSTVIWLSCLYCEKLPDWLVLRLRKKRPICVSNRKHAPRCRSAHSSSMFTRAINLFHGSF